MLMPPRLLQYFQLDKEIFSSYTEQYGKIICIFLNRLWKVLFLYAVCNCFELFQMKKNKKQICSVEL